MNKMRPLCPFGVPGQGLLTKLPKDRIPEGAGWRGLLQGCCQEEGKTATTRDVLEHTVDVGVAW